MQEFQQISLVLNYMSEEFDLNNVNWNPDNWEMSAAITEANAKKHYFKQTGSGSAIGTTTKYPADVEYYCQKCNERFVMHVTGNNFNKLREIDEFLSGECNG